MNVTYINRTEAENRHFYNLVNNQHDRVKRERTEMHAKRTEHTAIGLCIITVVLIMAAIL